jgi:hypothetical protein
MLHLKGLRRMCFTTSAGHSKLVCLLVAATFILVKEPALIGNVRLGWKWLTVTNAFYYFIVV